MFYLFLKFKLRKFCKEVKSFYGVNLSEQCLSFIEARDEYYNRFKNRFAKYLPTGYSFAEHSYNDEYWGMIFVTESYLFIRDNRTQKIYDIRRLVYGKYSEWWKSVLTNEKFNRFQRKISS